MLKFNFRVISRQKAIGLLELMLSLAVLAMVLVMATRFFDGARKDANAANALTDISVIVTNALALKTRGIAIENIGTIENYLNVNEFVNPFGAKPTLIVSDGKLTLNYADIPANICEGMVTSLKMKFDSHKCDKGLTIVFQ